MRPSVKNRLRAPILGGAFVLALIAGLAPFAVQGEDKTPYGVGERYLGHVSTDKPIYRAGETVYLRTVILHAFDRTPLKDGSGRAKLKIKNPRGSNVLEASFSYRDAAGGAKWQIPDGAAGGEYTAEVSFPNDGFPNVERKFDIRAYRTPRIKTQLEFLKKAYGPGDTVICALSTERAEGGAPADAKVTAVARIDGREVWRGQTSVDARGNCAVSFDLPDEIESGVGSLTLVIEDGGVVESASKTLPILLQQIPVTFCPEGGDLVAGLECGLYFEAVTPWGDPADIKGEIVDADGIAVADFATAHEGRGRVAFTPKPGTDYFAKITEPAGITKLNPLPKVASSGVSLRAGKPCYEPGEPLGFDVSATKGGAYKLVLFQRENEVAVRKVELDEGESLGVTLAPGDTIDGVLRATLMDADDEPLAERLVFRRPAQQVSIEIEATPQNAVPGDKVTLKVKTTHQNGEPVSAVVGLTVTDDAVLQMIEKRKQAPRLPVMAFFENEVDHLEDAHVYLSDDPVAETGVDLLLGTQGWRRFAYVNPAEFMKEHGDKGKRVIAYRKEIIPHRNRVGLGGAAGGAPRGGPRAAAAPEAEADDADGGAPVEDASEGAQGADDEQNAAEEVEEVEALPKVADRAMRRDEAREAPRVPMVRIREYAHQLREGRRPGDRSDFTETLYWNAGLKTDDKGEAEVSFYLSDSVTSFRVMADAYTQKGELGQADALITSRQPFYIEPKLPLEVTAGDRVLIPVNLINATDGGMKVVLDARSGKAISLPENFNGELELQADERGRLLLPVTVGRANGKVSLTLAGKAGPFSDRVTREIAVRPMGFPISYSVGGMLDSPRAFTVAIPEDVHVSTITTSAKVYPTPAANMMAAVERLIREPYG